MSEHDYNVPMSRRESFQRGYDEGFRAGAEAGIRLYAHWKDGVQYVGTCGKTLEQALAKLPEPQ